MVNAMYIWRPIANSEGVYTSHKNAIRTEVERCILEAAAKPRRERKRSSSNEKVCAMLRKKDVIYVKADKGHAVVLMDKNDYDGKIE